MTDKASKARALVVGAVVAVGLLLVATSCSEKDSDSATTSTTTTTSSPSATNEAPVGDQADAEASLITTSDVPADFTMRRSSPSDSDNPFLGVAECAPYEAAIKASDDERTAKATVSFEGFDEQTIQNQVEVYTDAKIATDSAAVLTDPGFPACIEAAFRVVLISGGLPPDSSIDSVRAVTAEVPNADELGVDSVAAFSLDISLTVEGEAMPLKSGIVMITSGRALSQVSTQGASAIDVAATVRAAAEHLAANAPA